MRFISSEMLGLFRKMIQERTGIYIAPIKDIQLQIKLEKVADQRQVKSWMELYQWFKSGEEDALHHLINAVTVNYSYFFRDRDHLDFLAEEIKELSDRPRIWCSACSTGEEVYSIVITLLENQCDDFFLLASDIDRQVLAHSNRGIYHESRLEHVTPLQRQQFFLRGIGSKEGYYRIRRELRRHFILKRLNLVHSMRFEAQFDVIFCRNVLIYFDSETQEIVLQNLLKSLVPGGILFLGQAESIRHLHLPVKNVGPSVYRKKAGKKRRRK